MGTAGEATVSGFCAAVDAAASPCRWLALQGPLPSFVRSLPHPFLSPCDLFIHTAGKATVVQ